VWGSEKSISGSRCPLPTCCRNAIREQITALINAVPTVLSQVTAACPVFIASRWSCAPPPRFDLIRAIREPRVPDSDPARWKAMS
jgi:hypothetical protein